jgi:Ni,Fe-hydrogenase I cytochrome b subunit
MSLINATLVAQAIHFSIAFILIKYLLFKPVFAQIEQEDKLQESLIATVQSHQQTVASKEQELTSGWYALRSYFAAHVPLIKSTHVPVHKSAEVLFPILDSKNIQMGIEKATQEIKNKVNNVW